MNWKKIISGLSLGLGLAAFASSCNKEVNVTLERRAKDETSFHAFKDSVGYKPVSLPGLYGDGYVYMKWLSKGESTQKPKATDHIKMHYDGYILTGWIGGQKQGLFDTNFDQEVLTPFAVNGLILGMRVALQNMVVGDEALVAIPWYLGYGSEGTRRISPYSSLVFRVKLQEIETPLAQ